MVKRTWRVKNKLVVSHDFFIKINVHANITQLPSIIRGDFGAY